MDLKELGPKLKELATRKFGPLPGWAWAGLGLATIGVTIYLSRSGAPSSLTGGSGQPQTPQGSGAGAGGGGDLGGGLGDTTPPAPSNQVTAAGQSSQPATSGGSPLIQPGGQQDGGAGGGIAPVQNVWTQNPQGGWWNPNPDNPTGAAITAGGPNQTPEQQSQALANYDAQLSAQLAAAYAKAHAPTPGGETSGAGPVGQDVNAYGGGPQSTSLEGHPGKQADNALIAAVPHTQLNVVQYRAPSSRRGGPQKY